MAISLNHKFARAAEIKDIQQDHAVLVFEDGQEIKWPKNLLPENAQQGTKLRVLVHDQETDEQEREQIARSLLNEIVEADSDEKADKA